MTPHQFDAAAELYNHRPDRRGPAAVIKHHLTVQTLRRSAKLIATSRWVVDSLTADYGIAESSVEVIPHGVEVEAWRPTNRIEPNPPIILFVGGDFHRKGGELLLQWFCSRGRGRCELHIVSADAPARILDEAGVHVHRDLRANSPELKRLFWDSSIFCLPSRDEPFGIACVEALAAGLPAVVTRVGGLQEIVDDGSTGLAVSPGDGEALGAALERLLDSRPLRLAMGQAAQQAASQRFDSRVNMRRTLDVLKGTVRLRGTQRAMQSHRIA